jgi:hypothetical protein
MFGVILDAAHVLMGLAVISTTSDVTTDVARRKTVTKIRRVLVDLLISIAVTIAVVVTMTSTTFLSALITTAATAITTAVPATTTWGIGWGRIVAMLATWMLCVAPGFPKNTSANYMCAQDVHTTHIVTNMENIKSNDFIIYRPYLQ